MFDLLDNIETNLSKLIEEVLDSNLKNTSKTEILVLLEDAQGIIGEAGDLLEDD